MPWSKLFRRRDFFGEVFDDAFARIPALVEAPSQALCRAVILGGCSGAFLAVSSVLEKRWRRGDETKAILLSRLFALATLSRWLWEIDSPEAHSEEDKARARREWASAVMSALGDYSQESMHWYVNYDLQYRYDRERASQVEGDGPVLGISDHMLHAMAVEVLGGPPAKLPTTGYPWQSFRDFIERGQTELPSWNPVDAVAFSVCVTRGHGKSIEYYGDLSARADESK